MSSDLALKLQLQGDYVGYDSIARDISIPKLSENIGTETISASDSQTNDSGFNVEVNETDDSYNVDVIDMSRLKAMPDSARTSTPRYHPPKPPPRIISKIPTNNGHTRHNSYTIYEERSDLSGSESIGAIHEYERRDNLDVRHQADTESQSSCSGKTIIQRIALIFIG